MGLKQNPTANGPGLYRCRAGLLPRGDSLTGPAHCRDCASCRGASGVSPRRPKAIALLERGKL